MRREAQPGLARLELGARRARLHLAGERQAVPDGVIVFPKDILPAPRAWGERVLNLQHWTEAPRGGHFPGLEAPEVLAQDLRAFFQGRD